MREGLGAYTWPDGAEYVGGFQKGVQDGCGRQRAQGWLWGEDARIGRWKAGKFGACLVFAAHACLVAFLDVKSALKKVSRDTLN